MRNEKSAGVVVAGAGGEGEGGGSFAITYVR
jgi:hypothetical protein